MIPVQAKNDRHGSQSIKTNESYITIAPGEVKLPGHRLGVPLETGRTNNVVRLVIFDRFGILLIMNRSNLYKSVDIVVCDHAMWCLSFKFVYSMIPIVYRINL